MIGSPEELTVVIKCIMITSSMEKEAPQKKGSTVLNHPPSTHTHRKELINKVVSTGKAPLKRYAQLVPTRHCDSAQQMNSHWGLRGSCEPCGSADRSRSHCWRMD